MSRLHRQPANEIRRRTSRKKQNRQPQRYHPHNREIREVHVLDHPVAKNAQLRSYRSGHFSLPRDMSVQGIKRNRRDGQTHGCEVRPRSTAKQANRGKPHCNPQKRHFIGRPSHIHLPQPDPASAHSMATFMPVLAPAKYLCSVTYRRHRQYLLSFRASQIRHLSLICSLLHFVSFCRLVRLSRVAWYRRSYTLRVAIMGQTCEVRRQDSRIHDCGSRIPARRKECGSSESTSEIYGRMKGRVSSLALLDT